MLPFDLLSRRRRRRRLSPRTPYTVYLFARHPTAMLRERKMASTLARERILFSFCLLPPYGQQCFCTCRGICDVRKSMFLKRSCAPPAIAFCISERQEGASASAIREHGKSTEQSYTDLSRNEWTVLDSSFLLSPRRRQKTLSMRSPTVCTLVSRESREDLTVCHNVLLFIDPLEECLSFTIRVFLPVGRGEFKES